jgi:hypothetical protein
MGGSILPALLPEHRRASRYFLVRVMTDREHIGQLTADICGPPEIPTEPPRRRQRKPTLASVAKQANKAGIPVARYEVEDGKISIIVGQPESPTTNPWDVEIERLSKQ